MLKDREAWRAAVHGVTKIWTRLSDWTTTVKYESFLTAQAEQAMAPHSSTLAWRIPWTEEPGRLQSMGSLRVGHDWVTSLSLFTFMHWRRKWQPTPVFLPGGLLSMGLHRIGHNWSKLAAAAAAWLKGWRIHLQCRRHRRCQFNPWVRKIPWRRAWQPSLARENPVNKEA